MRARFQLMRIREENRNMFLLSAVTLFSGVVAGTFALLEPVFEQSPETAFSQKVSAQQVADNTPVDATTRAPVRVVGGTPFVPNVNPRER
ncbi:MAG TPA: hypothetical protein VK968_13725 [Roseimicrobium sp.]|nr:hypothetical protein [Roseimicrobium sp.]